MSAETVFQRVERQLDEWDGVSPPVERAIFRDTVKGVSAVVDPFGGRDGVVVYSHGDSMGFKTEVDKSMFEMSPYEYTKVGLVVRAVGSKMLGLAGVRYGDDAAAMRVVARVDGFAVPDHAHVVLALAKRGETFIGRRSDDNMEASWQALKFDRNESYLMESQLSALHSAVCSDEDYDLNQFRRSDL